MTIQKQLTIQVCSISCPTKKIQPLSSSKLYSVQFTTVEKVIKN